MNKGIIDQINHAASDEPYPKLTMEVLEKFLIELSELEAYKKLQQWDDWYNMQPPTAKLAIDKAMRKEVKKRYGI